MAGRLIWIVLTYPTPETTYDPLRNFPRTVRLWFLFISFLHSLSSRSRGSLSCQRTSRLAAPRLPARGRKGGRTARQATDSLPNSMVSRPVNSATQDYEERLSSFAKHTPILELLPPTSQSENIGSQIHCHHILQSDHPRSMPLLLYDSFAEINWKGSIRLCDLKQPTLMLCSEINTRLMTIFTCGQEELRKDRPGKDLRICTKDTIKIMGQNHICAAVLYAQQLTRILTTKP